MDGLDELTRSGESVEAKRAADRVGHSRFDRAHRALVVP
jgi:hypothetical protein